MVKKALPWSLAFLNKYVDSLYKMIPDISFDWDQKRDMEKLIPELENLSQDLDKVVLNQHKWHEKYLKSLILDIALCSTTVPPPKKTSEVRGTAKTLKPGKITIDITAADILW